MNLAHGVVRNGFVSVVRHHLRSRDFFVHDGAAMRRVHLSTRSQVAGLALGVATSGLSLFAVAQIGMGAPVAAIALRWEVSRNAAVTRMNAKVVAMEAEMAAIRAQAAEHAKRLELRQAALDAMVSGKGAVTVAFLHPSGQPNARLRAVIAPLAGVEGKQNQLAQRLAAVTEAKYRLTTRTLGRLGLDASRFHRVSGAQGGPYEPLPADTGRSASAQTDQQFRTLFQSWKRLEQLQQGIVAVPSQRPVQSMTFTSGFGVRSDPFRGSAAMHAGVDMPGAIGTPIYATADGIVNRAQWVNGYGNLVEIDHGKGIQTRYGHLSAFVVSPGTHVTRGQLIAKMGSTGRSTGSHLHYEVRLDGHAVNPMPFLQTSSYFAAMRPALVGAMGGPGAD